MNNEQLKGYVSDQTQCDNRVYIYQYRRCVNDNTHDKNVISGDLA